MRSITGDCGTSWLLASVVRRREVNFTSFILNGTNMGSSAVLLSIFAVVLMVAYTEAAGNCPLPSKVYGCSPKCVQDYECTNGKVCCSNSCNAKSCSEPASNGAGSHSSNKYSTGGSGQYCDNVKCNSFEVCKTDPATKRLKCSRP